MEGISAVQQRILAIEARFPTGRPAMARAGAAAPASFGTALDAALAKQSPALTPATRLQPGQYGKLQPPAELSAYGNGRIPDGSLQSIGGGERLWKPAAEAFTTLQADARRAGVDLKVTDSYRDLAGQERVAAAKGLYSQGGLAARPGTSTHGWGLSVDLSLDGPAQSWMRENGWRYGFVEDVAREPWHWTYRPA